MIAILAIDQVAERLDEQREGGFEVDAVGGEDQVCTRELWRQRFTPGRKQNRVSGRQHTGGTSVGGDKDQLSSKTETCSAVRWFKRTLRDMISRSGLVCKTSLCYFTDNACVLDKNWGREGTNA